MALIKTDTNPRLAGWHPLTQAGDWRLRRQIIDHRRGGLEGSLVGICTLKPLGHGLLSWEEQGTLTMGEHHGDAWRRYRIAVSADQVDVRFEDEAPFFTLKTGLATGQTEPILHLCGDDRYSGVFRLLSQEEWQLDWRINGPRKDLEIKSRYRLANLRNSALD